MKQAGKKRLNSLKINYMNTPWDKFTKEKLTEIFTKKKYIIDIGGGLRLDASRGNKISEANSWLKPYLKNVDYKILDKVGDYHPDIISDIHQLSLQDNSVDAIICIAVLQHVENPLQAVSEIYWVLKPGGFCFIYVPFLFYYHPLPGYYKDFYRFTYDGVSYLAKDFKNVEIQNVRGALATLMNLFPFFSKRTGIFNYVDKFFKLLASKQTSGYNIFCVK